MGDISSCSFILGRAFIALANTFSLFAWVIAQVQTKTCIYNLSFTTGIFPDSLKIAKVTPVYKKGSKLECATYRPIILLSNIDKIIEKLLHKRLIRFLKDQKVLYKKPYGFQKYAAHAVVSLIKILKRQQIHLIV